MLKLIFSAYGYSLLSTTICIKPHYIHIIMALLCSDKHMIMYIQQDCQQTTEHTLQI